jgi:nitroimidazol reductase NimA-like FMN-containing flavoprotein (pyridoxamine 5'-phosphate oxidase superfamily)
LIQKRDENQMDKEQIRRVTGRIRDLLASQKLAVLSTHNKGAPYASLVAYAADDSLEFLLFATPRTTRKFANLSAEPRAALLVNDSRNETEDFHKAAAVTITGRTEVVEGEKRAELAPQYLAAHPHLEDFINSETCALFRMDAEVYYLVENFQKVSELHIKS